MKKKDIFCFTYSEIIKKKTYIPLNENFEILSCLNTLISLLISCFNNMSLSK